VSRASTKVIVLLSLPSGGPTLPRPLRLGGWLADPGRRASRTDPGNVPHAPFLSSDPYENIYTVIRGSKTFILYPPTEFYCLHGTQTLPRPCPHEHPCLPHRPRHSQLIPHRPYLSLVPPRTEQVYPSASFQFAPPSSFTLVPTSPPQLTPWIPLDPLAPSALHTRHSLARPYTVTLHPGDSLYLPALWFHHVSQTAGPGPSPQDRQMVIAVNWWSDMRMEGHLWAATQLVRRLTLSLDGREEPSLDSEEESD